VTYLDPDGDGLLRPAALRAALRPETALVSIMHGNNETGVVQDLEALSGVCREAGVLLHSDAAQSAGKLPLDVRRMGLDLLSVSGHKMHGPKGAGALFVRRRGRRVSLAPLLEGGGQERGLRSGTLNVPAIVGFGAACRLAREAMAREPAEIAALRDRLEEGILGLVPQARRNGPAAPRLPGISNLYFEGISGEALLLALHGVAFSSGSACASASLEPSHVLLALGLSPEVARNSLRLSLGRFNTAAEVEFVIGHVAEAVLRLTEKGPGGESA
jgi:cysteine desulfurase